MLVFLSIRYLQSLVQTIRKPDAITTMYKSEFKQKAWSLPVADLLYVGKSTNRKLALFGIKTIGDLARADEEVLNSHLGKMGSILWSFANGYDDSPVKLENTHAPIKSVGNSTTTPKDLVCDEDVKIVLYILAESVAARLRENGFRCRVVEISVRDNELFSFTRQKKIDHATNITGEIAAYAYQIFKENYNWSKPIRSVGVRGADLVTDNYWEQIDLFSSVEKREKQMKMDSAVDEIRRRFGFYSIQRGLMYRDRILSAVNARINLVDRAPLTEKQQNVYESIMQYQRVNGYAPTIREICKMVGVASTSSVYAHLKILEEKGYIARKMDASRAIAIL